MKFLRRFKLSNNKNLRLLNESEISDILSNLVDDGFIIDFTYSDFFPVEYTIDIKANDKGSYFKTSTIIPEIKRLIGILIEDGYQKFEVRRIGKFYDDIVDPLKISKNNITSKLEELGPLSSRVRINFVG